MVDVIRRKHLSRSTEHSYVGWLKRYIGHIGSVPRDWSSEAKFESFLTSLARSGVSASTQNQAFNAVLFFHREVLRVELGRIDSLRAKVPETVRTAPTAEEVRQLLARVEDVGGYPTKLVVRMLYGMGLRVSEPLELRIKDLDLAASRVVIRGAKGGKDRVLAIPCSLMSDLRAQMAVAEAVAQRDRLSGIPIALPGLLAAKYPAMRFSKAWAWLFPARSTCVDDRTGQTVRWRLHEVNVQRAVRAAVKPLGLWLTPHHLRHAYATHALQAGANPRALQDALGHASMETTTRYCHADAMGVRSPLDALAVRV